jgi:hypothetical protein
MSQIANNEAVVHMLPPSFAVYLGGAVIVPVFIQPGQGTSSAEVYVPPLMIAANIVRVHWCLFNSKLSSDPNALYEFALKKSGWHEGAIKFRNASDDKVPFLGSLYEINPSQIAMDNFTLGLDTRTYDLYFRFPGTSPRLVIRAAVDADPSVAITPDPVEIPTWP